MEINEKKRIGIREWYVLVVYGVYLIRTIGAWSLLPSKIDSIIFGLAGLCGAVLLAKDLLDVIMRKRPFEYDWFLILFLVALVVSAVVNHQYSMIGNFKVAAWQAIILLFIYQIAKDKNTAESFFTRFQLILIGFGFIMAVVSIGMFIMQYSYIHVLIMKQNPLRIGFVGNRLFGLYIDPNYAAVIAVVGIVFSIMLWRKYAVQLWQKILLGLNIFVQLSYIGLSGSRNGQVVLASVTLVGCFFILLHGNILHHKNLILRLISGVIVGLVCAVIAVGATRVLSKGYAQIPPAIGTIGANHDDVTDKGGDVSVDTTRADVAKSNDVSNLRFTIWQSAFHIWERNKIFGIPSKSVHDYAKNEMPSTYLAQTKLAIHNAYLNLLVTTGLIGTILMLLFIIKSLVRVLKRAFTDPTMLDEQIYYVLVALALAVSGLFQNELFMMATSSAIVFWICMGRLNMPAKYEHYIELVHR